MAAGSRFSTTVIDSEYLVPWLSPEGPLAYSPTEPPARDYFFQYTWILPGIFNPQVNLRQHRFIGSPLNDSARFLFDFWANALRGDGPARQRYCQFGFFSDNELRTPIAAYHHVRDYRDTPGSLLIQHGSYQWVSLEDQPSIPAGEVSLYRGIGQATRFPCWRLRPEELSPANGEIWLRYLRVQAGMLSDSILSFNTIHDRLKRYETARPARRDLGARRTGHAGWIRHSITRLREGSLARRPAVVFARAGNGSSEVRSPPCRRQAPLSKIRITTFFAAESEAKIVDPSRNSEVQAVGCEVDFAPPME